jgi:hypothetical protein
MAASFKKIAASFVLFVWKREDSAKKNNFYYLSLSRKLFFYKNHNIWHMTAATKR